MTWVALNAALIIGILAEFFSGPLGVLAVSTGLSASGLRALAILRGMSTERVEWMTAAGFAGGAASGALVLVLDFAIG